MKCRMCDADYFIRVKDITKTLFKPRTVEEALIESLTYEKIRPRFCPFCGRNLGDEEGTHERNTTGTHAKS